PACASRSARFTMRHTSRPSSRASATPWRKPGCARPGTPTIPAGQPPDRPRPSAAPAMHPLAELDLRHLWPPFTQMRDWLASEPVVIASGRGAVLRDVHGRRYLDANASIWTNLHGHRHPAINRAIRRQLNRIAHSSALGLANEPASLLGAQLI